MNRLFGASSSSKPKPNLQDAISSTDSRIDGIQVKVKKLDGELARYRDQMKKMRPGPGKSAVEQRALRTLRQKKQYEGQIEQLQQQTWNMEQASMTTENLRNTMATVDAMKQANKELKKQYGKIDIDKIESVHYDMEDLLESANEIQATMGRSYGVPDELDEADLQAELEALEDDLAFESVSGNDEAIPSYLKEDMSEPLPDLVDPKAEDPGKQAAKAI